MKKLFVASVLALALTAGSRQTASAWSEFKFSAGVNMGWVGGGNRLFWGAYRSAPYPGGQDLGPLFPGVAAAANGGNYYGGGGYGGGGYGPAVDYAHPPVAPVAPVNPVNPIPAGPQHSYNPYYNAGYQPVGYSYPGYSGYQVPSYWYGR